MLAQYWLVIQQWRPQDSKYLFLDLTVESRYLHNYLYVILHIFFLWSMIMFIYEAQSDIMSGEGSTIPWLLRDWCLWFWFVSHGCMINAIKAHSQESASSLPHMFTMTSPLLIGLAVFCFAPTFLIYWQKMWRSRRSTVYQLPLPVCTALLEIRTFYKWQTLAWSRLGLGTWKTCLSKSPW